jgi:hypothetical protein
MGYFTSLAFMSSLRSRATKKPVMKLARIRQIKSHSKESNLLILAITVLMAE